jgi:hypothetical protein
MNLIFSTKNNLKNPSRIISSPNSKKIIPMDDNTNLSYTPREVILPPQTTTVVTTNLKSNMFSRINPTGKGCGSCGKRSNKILGTN